MLNTSDIMSTNISSIKNITSVTHLSYVLVISCPACIFLHIVGLYMITQNKIFGMHKIDRLIIINLSVAEIFLSGIFLLFAILNFAEKEIEIWIRVLIKFFIFAYYITIFLLTLNRFFILYLDVKYESVITKKKAKIILFFSWICSLAFAYFTLKPSKNIAYVHLSLDVGVSTLYIFVYAYVINLSYKMSKKKSLLQKRKSLLQTLVLPALYVSTYILFTAIPHFIYAPYYILDKTINKHLELVLDIFSSLSYWNDAVIYIYTKKIKRFLTQKRYKYQCKEMLKLRRKQVDNSERIDTETSRRETSEAIFFF
ncbi:uncharacterized protein LOC105843510 [Hydra vulgaris]|uniref:uncharacterized protein LOC105843510 n=1 Tax=Hydra vulgaris TaxID=6087 RepID=UPI0006411735|nr:uncharacterized protein LOC105843510 [Hydra vulgaris]XP_012554419.1 uncharacterized protein LOC105843510 [Hydra vulgaris]XP_047137945.1 uncharacterized protein LOC105843510 [Hydra vulgaris]XP_047137946.1 uncharacterized protein LOC105843510 [Hydra vulgaris]